MSRADVLRTIKDAEADASATLAKAESEASNIVTKARIAAAETVSEGRTQAQADAQQMIDDARKAADIEATKVSKKGDKTIDSIHGSGESSRPKAVDVVLDAFRE